MEGNTKSLAALEEREGFLFCFCGERADHRAWSSVFLSCVWSRWDVHRGAASQRWGWDWRRGRARQAQAGDTSKEASVKLVANNGCPRNRRNGATVFPNCLFSIIQDVWKGHYSSFKKKKKKIISFLFSSSFFLLWEAWDLTAWALVQHLFWPRFWSLLFSLTFCSAGYYLLKTCI